MDFKIKLGKLIADYFERRGLIIISKEERTRLDKSRITIDESIIFLEKALDEMVSFEGNEKIDFVLDVVDEYKKQLKHE